MKNRLDLVLMEQKLFASRRQAQGAIMAGRILVNGQKIDKPGAIISREAQIKILGEDPPYVSRGGLKLAKALDVFPIKVKDARVLDVGASTGGFTDCVLQKGAREVIAVDVGYGQLAWKLRQDARVKVLERTNVRNLTLDLMDQEQVDLVTVDVSFISLKLVIPPIMNLVKATGDFIFLVKPQFEAGKDKVGKRGVVRDPVIHQEVILSIIEACIDAGLFVHGLDFSPITGPEGNIEYLLWVKRGQESDWSTGLAKRVEYIVKTAQDTLG